MINAESESVAPPKREDEEEILIKGNQFEQKEETSFTSEPKAATEKAEEEVVSEKPKLQGIKVVGKIDLDKGKPAKKEDPKVEDKEPEPEPEKVEEPSAPEATKAQEEEPVQEQVEEPTEEKSEDEASEDGKKVIEAKAETLKGLKVLV